MPAQEFTIAFRANPALGKPIVNDEGTFMRRTVGMEIGEATGHNVEADQRTLEAMARLGNAKPRGVMSRFGHPAMSENAMGKRVATASNFRVEEGVLYQDMEMFEPARKSPAFGGADPIEYIVEASRNQPDKIGLSAVITMTPTWVLSDGSEEPADNYRERPEDATTRLPVIRPTKLHALDFVSEGALTSSMFSLPFGNDESFYAEQAFFALDQWRERFNINLEDVSPKVETLLARYLHLRKETPPMSIFTTDGDATDAQVPTGDIAQLHKAIAGLHAAFTNQVVPALGKMADIEHVVQGIPAQFETVKNGLDAYAKTVDDRLDALDKRIASLEGTAPAGTHPVTYSPTRDAAPSNVIANKKTGLQSDLETVNSILNFGSGGVR